MALPKTYEVLARLGAVSTTGDPEGQITITGKLPDPAAVLPEGLVRQRPPAYSAVKIDGERAYRRARRGEEVRTREREVHVERFECLWREDDRAAYRITCSAGTYVRALIADLGDAYCERLRRTRIGPFAVQEASLEDLRPAPQQLIDGLIGVPEALEFLPQVRLESEDARRAAHGRPVPAPPALHASAGGAAAVSVLVTDDRGAVAVTELAAAEGGWVLRPVIGFRA
jgi:tRNA pseudouridine55 synthase